MKKKILLLLPIFIFCSYSHGQKIKRNISIDTDKSSLIFSVDLEDEIIFRHYGKRVNNLGDFSQELRKITANQPAVVLYPTYGGRRSIIPALKLTHADGVLVTELKFHNIKFNEIDDNIRETIIKLKDKEYELYVNLHYKAYKKENIISQYVTISHNEKGNIKVENLASCYLPLYAQSYYLSHFHGTWAREMQMEDERLTHGVKSIENIKGVRTTQTENSSFLISLDGKSEEYSGEVYAGTLAWSGNYKLSFQLTENGMLNIVAGMNPFASTFVLEVGKEIKTPEMILAYSAEGKSKISQNFHDWSRTYALAHGNELRPIVLNSWEGVYFDFDENKILSIIDDAADFGIEMFVLDDGWFGNKYPRNKANAGLGDWQVNKQKLPHGIGYLADYAVKKGIKFGLWVEPEMVNPQSDLAHKHPDWIVKTGKYTPYEERNQWLLDLSNPEVQAFVEKTIDNIVKMSPNISYLKWDANRHVNNVGSSFLSSDKQTHFWYEYVEGLYHVYDKIKAKYPHLMLQLCASGGGRLDYGALKYHDEFWPSDNTNAVDRIFIQHGTSMFFPAKAMASHVSTSPNHQTGMILPLKFRFDVAMSGRLGMELQPKDIKGKELDLAKQAIGSYKRIRPIVQQGDLYRLVSPYNDSNWASLMYVSKEKKDAVFFAYSIGYHSRDGYFKVKMKGLNPNKKYLVAELNRLSKASFMGNGKTLTGEYLMNVGILLNINKPYESCVLELKEVL